MYRTLRIVLTTVVLAGCSKPKPPATLEAAMENQQSNLEILIREVEADPKLSQPEKEAKIADIRKGYEAQARLIQLDFAKSGEDERAPVSN